MKTAVSVPDDLFAAADDLARRLGVSRSELYATAVARYVEAMRSEGVTARLNEVYGSVDDGLDPALLAAQMAALDHERW